MKEVTVVRGPGYKQKPYEQVVKYPDDCTLHYDTNQSCLLIKRANGEPLAAFRAPASMREVAGFTDPEDTE